LWHQDQEQHINGYTNHDYNCADPPSDGLDFGISIDGELDRLSELVKFSKDIAKTSASSFLFCHNLIKINDKERVNQLRICNIV
jgi:hypothetical protein